MATSRVAERYAKSLIDLAIEKGQLEEIYADMNFLKHLYQQSRELVMVLKSPIIHSDKKQGVLDALTKGKISGITEAFNRLLIKKGREAALPEMIDAFITRYKKHKQIHVVHLTSAAPLSDNVRNSIVSKVKKELNIEHIELNTTVNPEILGGFILKIGDSIIDTSIESELKAIQKQFQNNDYIYQIR